MILFIGNESSERLTQWVDYIRDDQWYIVINRTDADFSRYVAMALANHDPIVALGNSASGALYEVPHYKLPHPSARNKMNNDAGFIRSKLDECKTFIQNTSSLRNKVR